jgi:hypothetical protein
LKEEVISWLWADSNLVKTEKNKKEGKRKHEGKKARCVNAVLTG